LQNRQNPAIRLVEGWAGDPEQRLVAGMQRCDGTPRQSSEPGQIHRLAQWDGQTAIFNGGKVLGAYLYVDLLWITAWPLHDFDVNRTLLRRFQNQIGDGRAMTGNLAIASGPLTATEKEKALLALGGFNGEIQKLMSRRGVGDLDMGPGPGFDPLVS
jgi:hypothetical protein